MEEPSAPKLTCPVAYREWHRILSRIWQARLNASEFGIVNMIFDRTYGWGKEWEYISWEQFEKGIYSRDGERCFTHGTGLSTSTIKRALIRLEQIGCIRVEESPQGYRRGGYRYALNFEWNPDMPLAVPKEKAARSSLAEPKPRGQKELTLGSKRTNPKVNLTGKEKDTEGAKAPTPKRDAALSAASLEDRIAEVKEKRNTQRLTEFNSLLIQKQLNRGQIESIWRYVFVEQFPEAPYFAWKEKEAHAIAAYHKRHGKIKAQATFGVYVEWCVRYWRRIMEQTFGWMSAPPPLPTVMFFVRFSDKFEMVFARRKEIEELSSLTTRDQMIRELTGRGVDYNVAVEEVDERLGLSKQLIELEEQRGALDRESKALARQKATPLKPMLQPVARMKEAKPVTKPVVPLVPAGEVDAPEKFEDY